MSRAAIIAVTRSKGPMTAKQLADELGIQASSVRTSLRRARAHGTKYIRIARWAMDVPAYGPGPAEDAEGGSTGQLILAQLSDGGPAPVAKLAVLLGIDVNVIDSAIRRLRKKVGLVHISGWKLTRGKGGREGAIFKSGPGRDKPRPDFTNSQTEGERRYAQKRRIKNIMAKR